MPAHNDNFPWMSYCDHYKFFEERMLDHDKVVSLDVIKAGLYDVKLKTLKVIRVFVCECYSFDIAEYHEVRDNYGDIDAIVIHSNWCGYTPNVKYYCMQKEVGVFDVGGFMGAINRRKFWTYITKEEKEREKTMRNNDYDSWY